MATEKTDVVIVVVNTAGGTPATAHHPPEPA